MTIKTPYAGAATKKITFCPGEALHVSAKYMGASSTVALYPDPNTSVASKPGHIGCMQT